MKHTKRWLALILAIALVAANASYQLGTSLYASEDQTTVETQSEESQTQEAVNTEEPKSTGSAQVEEVQEDQNTSDDAAQAEESKNNQADANASNSTDSVAEQNQADAAQANAVATYAAPTLIANTDGSVSGSGYDSIKLVVNTDGITNQNNTKFNIKFDTGNTENNKKISASNLNPSEGLASNLMKNRGGTYDVNGFNKNAFTITVTKGDNCKNSVKTEATVDVASGTVTLRISDYYESSYNDKTFTNPTATSLGSVNDFAVFAINYKNHVDMEGNIAVRNLQLANTNSGNSDAVQAKDFNLNYIENFELNSMNSEFFRKADPLIVGDAYEINTQDSNFNLKLANGSVINLGPSNKMKDVVNIKNSSYKIDFDTAMAGLRQYASTMYGKSDTEGMTFKSSDGSTTTKSGTVQTIHCKSDVNNIINIKASDLKKWADNVQITGLGDTGSVTFNIEYDVAEQFTKPHFTINGTGTGGYDATGGRILLNFGTQQGEITFGELYSGTILAPNATVDIYTTHNGSVFANTVENISGEIHKNPWKPGNNQRPTSVKVTLKGTKTLDGVSAQKDAFSFLLQQTDGNGAVLETGTQQTVNNGENGQISFNEITYNAPGTYYYKISEVKGNDANINYDASFYKVVVTVDENMTATVVYYDQNNNQVNGDTGAAFSNTSIVREVKASLQGNKTLNSKPSTAAYKYQVVEVADENGTAKDNAQSWEVTNNTTGNAAIEFPEFTYNAAGDYYYKVTEVNENADGMDYDPSVYIAHVSVATQNDGSLTASATYKKYAGADQINAESATDADKITFANKTLKAQVTFTGNKTVNGSEAKDKFSFKVVEKEKDGNVVNTIADNITNNTGEGENGAIQFPTIEYNKAGTHYYEISENSQTGNSVQYDKTTYTAVVEVTKSADGLVASTKYYKDYNYSDKSQNKEIKGTLDFANTMQTSIRLHGTKTLDGKAAKDAFTFAITQVDADGNAVANGYAEEVQNGENGAIESKDIPFTAPGTYYYKVTEKVGSKENIAYDNSYYTAVVTVEKKDLNLSASVQYYKNVNGKDVAGKTATDLTFQNTTKKASIQFSGQKTLLGKDQSTGAALTLQAGEFSFDIVEASANGTVKKDASTKTVQNKADGTITFPAYEYNATGDYYYRISEQQSSNPAIAGVDYDESIYLVHVKVANNEAGDAFVAQIQDVTKFADQAAMKDKKGTVINSTEIADNNVATFTNRVRYGSITFTGNKTLNGNPSAEPFRYRVVEKSKDGGTVTNGYNSGVITNDANGAIQFAAISYTKAGTYYYNVTEINDSAYTTGITYDKTVYTAVVTVTEDNSENSTGLVANVSYYKDFNYETKTGTEVMGITFANNMSASVSLEGTKTLDGKKVSKAGEYSFDIVETNASGDALESATLQTVSNDNAGKFTFPAYTYTDEGTHYYKITENQSNPKSGIKYDTSSYLVTVTVAKTVEDGKVSLKATVTDTKKTDANNTVTDTKDIIFNNQTITYSDAKIQLTATKNLSGKPSEKAFNFKMEECDENGNVTAGTKAVTASNDKKGLITFDELIYKDAGTHYYKISEVVPENPEANIVYDNAAYIVKVDVEKNDATAALTATASEYKKIVTGADGQTTTENAESVVFNNGIKASTSFTGQKYVDGELAATAGAFSFTLTRTDENYNVLTGEDAYSEKVSNASDGQIAFTEINYDTPGDYYYTISENVPEQREDNMYYDEAVYRAKVTVSAEGQVTVEKSVVPYTGYEGDDGKTSESVENDEFLMFNNYHLMTMSMNYALATITGTKTLTGGNLEAGEFRFGLYDTNGTLIDTTTNDASGTIAFRTIPYYAAGTYTYTVKEINEQGEDNVSDIEYDPSVYTVTVNVDENMDASITYAKDGVNVDNLSFENKMSVTAAVIDPSVTKVLNNAKLEPGEFTFQLFDENGQLVDTKKNTDSGSVLFDSIVFDKAGDYNYTIKELIPADPGQITYDGREIKVNVNVTKNNETGNLEAAVTYLEDNAPTENPTFVNTYNPINIRVQKTSKDGSKDPLKGATYALYKVLGDEGRDILIGTQVSDANGYMTFENVEPGTYYFKEISAPAGHTVDEYATKKFTVSADGSINGLTAKSSKTNTQAAVEGQAVMFSLDSLTEEEDKTSTFASNNNDTAVLAEAPGVSDEVTKLNVSKLDYTNHEFVAGAKMQILEKSSGKIVAEWTTGNSAESFERKLNVETPYILREVSAPEGYDLAKDTEFVIDAYGILSITSGPDAEKTSDTSLSLYDKKLSVTKVTTNTKENHNQKFVDVVKTVKTGDTAMIGLFAVLAIAAAVVVIIVLRRRKNS